MWNNSRIPRWFLENDPSWEKSIDSDLGILKWTKKGTGIQAVGHPTNLFCEIIGHDQSQTEGGIPDIGVAAGAAKMKSSNATLASGAGDITRYLGSRYLNPGINGPRFDLRRTIR